MPIMRVGARDWREGNCQIQCAIRRMTGLKPSLVSIYLPLLGTLT